MHWLVWLAVVCVCAQNARAHYRMTKPYPRGAPDNPALSESQKSYDLTSPMSSSTNPVPARPCKGLPAGPIVGTYKAGALAVSRV